MSKEIEILQEILGEELLGVYLYGSAVDRGLQKYSDIDLFAVLKRVTTAQEKAKLVEALLNMESTRPIELTLVVQSEVNPWRYPPMFDFQYGEWLRKEFEGGSIEPWSSKEMPDLAILITQLLLKSRTLFGDSPKKLLSPVPYHDFMRALEAGLIEVQKEPDIRNVLLTLARILYTRHSSAKKDNFDFVSG